MISIEDRVRFEETDLMGVVYHANYLHWFEMGRIAYLRAAGIDLNDLMQAGVMFPILMLTAIISILQDLTMNILFAQLLLILIGLNWFFLIKY